MPVAAGGVYVLPYFMRSRNTAICARVTGELGQYCGGAVEQPPVTPSVARRSMNRAPNDAAGTSLNIVPVAAGSVNPSPYLLTSRKTAICARVTAALGQYVPVL